MSHGGSASGLGAPNLVSRSARIHTQHHRLLVSAIVDRLLPTLEDKKEVPVKHEGNHYGLECEEGVERFVLLAPFGLDLSIPTALVRPVSLESGAVMALSWSLFEIKRKTDRNVESEFEPDLLFFLTYVGCRFPFVLLRPVAHILVVAALGFQ
eukprot:813275-Amphidinium_carterae.1